MKNVLLFVSLLMAIAIATFPTHSTAGEAENIPSTQTEQININTANADQLTHLKGIGKKKAEAIVAYRNSFGEFASVNELTDVKGIGPSLLEKNRHLISLQ